MNKNYLGHEFIKNYSEGNSYFYLVNSYFYLICEKCNCKAVYYYENYYYLASFKQCIYRKIICCDEQIIKNLLE